MKILHIEINEYESNVALSNAMSTIDAGLFVVAKDYKDAEKQIENFYALQSNTRVFYSKSEHFEGRLYHALYECLID